MTRLEVENLSIRFAGRAADNDVHAVRGLSFTLEPGECVAIVGESGSGKSATARALVGLAGDNALIEADAMRLGQTRLDDLDRNAWRAIRGRQIGFVLQDALVSLDPLRTVGAEIAETLRQHRIVPRHRIKDRVISLLESVGVPEPALRVRQYAHELSGGLRQRALIASALSGEPDLLIADEPTTALDVIVQAQILDLLDQMKHSGKGILLISHDLAVVARLADRIIVMKDGQVVEAGTPRAILTDPQADYTRQLLDAIPSASTRGRSLFSNDTPSAAAPARTGPVREIINVSNISHRYKKREVVKNVSFSVSSGETLGIVGASGSGKTTVARIIMGLVRPSEGDVEIEGRPWSALHERARRALRPNIQLISQDPLSAFDPRYRVKDIIGEALEIRGLNRDERRGRTLELLESVGLGLPHLDRRPLQLSGGQRQRVAIARALALSPDILICDEPVSALDVSTQAQVLDLLDDLKRRFDLTMVFVSHDLGVIRHVSDRVIVMHNGQVVEHGDVDAVMGAPQHEYTKRLVTALPDLSDIQEAPGAPDGR
ncbi:dipeptide ABC transporter ATP-binding protein [Pelagibacterium sp.]|uniref:dipeptide ABC transporter ATP-binding protein n=1 Tax=Pelagibacterium sp. TaxID=1967288 RepID=UPI003A8F0ADD